MHVHLWDPGVFSGHIPRDISSYQTIPLLFLHSVGHFQIVASSSTTAIRRYKAIYC